MNMHHWPLQHGQKLQGFLLMGTVLYVDAEEQIGIEQTFTVGAIMFQVAKTATICGPTCEDEQVYCSKNAISKLLATFFHLSDCIDFINEMVGSTKSSRIIKHFKNHQNHKNHQKSQKSSKHIQVSLPES